MLRSLQGSNTNHFLLESRATEFVVSSASSSSRCQIHFVTTKISNLNKEMDKMCRGHSRGENVSIYFTLSPLSKYLCRIFVSSSTDRFAKVMKERQRIFMIRKHLPRSQKKGEKLKPLRN